MIEMRLLAKMSHITAVIKGNYCINIKNPKLATITRVISYPVPRK
jgi:hypothetical protein